MPLAYYRITWSCILFRSLRWGAHVYGTILVSALGCWGERTWLCWSSSEATWWNRVLWEWKSSVCVVLKMLLSFPSFWTFNGGRRFWDIEHLTQWLCQITPFPYDRKDSLLTLAAASMATTCNILTSIPGAAFRRNMNHFFTNQTKLNII